MGNDEKKLGNAALVLRPIGIEPNSFLVLLSGDFPVTCPYQRNCDLSIVLKASNSKFNGGILIEGAMI